MSTTSQTDKPTSYPDGYDHLNIEGGMYWQDANGTWWIFRADDGTALGRTQMGYYSYDTEKELTDANFRLNLTKVGSEYNTDNPEDIITIGPLKGTDIGEKTLRYPNDVLHKESDYVLFQFGKYIPPFSRTAARTAKENKEDEALKAFTVESYNASTNLKIEEVPQTGKDGIILPMPQDLGNDLQQTWTGKEFSAIGRTAIAGAVGGDLSAIEKRLRDAGGNLTSIITGLQAGLLNKVPGVGGNFEIGDLTGSTQGIVLNPNAEVLYESPELREIGMTFKLVPRNADEAKTVKSIIRMFRFASLPQWGGKGLAYEKGQLDKNQPMSMSNFIRVPWLCKFTFMKGGSTSRHVEQFKPCAIKRVAVNYTPDGSYATYQGGEPVATELTLNFLEIKALFKSDINTEPGEASF